MRDKNYPCFRNEWLWSQRLDGGIVHAVSPTRERLKEKSGHIWENRGWATFCAKGLSHNNLPGETCDVATTPITCIQCLGALKT